MELKPRKILRLSGKILFMFALGGLGALWAGFWLMPRLSDSPYFSHFGFVKRFRENVTIINKTEQITVNEDLAVNKIAAPATGAAVRIVSVPEPANASLSGAETKSGTGLILTGDGLIVTYRDAIIEKKSGYRIFLGNGSAYEAELAGIDNFSNLAYLKVSGTNFSTLSFTNSDDVMAGKGVIVISSATGDHQYRLTVGIVNEISKTYNLADEAVASAGKLEGVFLIGSGSPEIVGSPVIAYNGDAVGIVGRKKIDNLWQYFIVPSNRIKESMERQIRGELAKMANPGFYYLSLDKVAAAVRGSERSEGALVYAPSGKQGLAILANSPAQRAGLRISDIVLAVDGQAVDLDHPLSNILSRYRNGDEAELKVLRNEEEVIIRLIF